ncbi:hypothetical protein Cgig2_010306 [Carnegiea gigantea]|uniref:NAC domain-containing protein n=1 Tax=Carnegiea gigantea TaxID=171969 RepID=A0A9Q1KIF7_9CARY|nr:hypothetical protein Cgig2_010306 [Carnegiea gigantea]
MPSTSKNQETILQNNGGTSRRKWLPPGWQFNPTDEELLLHFLRPKNNTQPICPDIIHGVHLYSYCPDDLTTSGVLGFLFVGNVEPEALSISFMTDRTAGNGYWTATGSNDAVRDGKKRSIIGHKRALSFFHGQQSEKNLNNKTCWLMHEYQLWAPKEETEPSGRKGKREASTPGSQPESQGDKEASKLWKTYFLCIVYPNSKKEDKNTVHEEQQEVEPILGNTQRQDTSTIQQEQVQQEVEPIRADLPINSNSIVAPPTTLNRTHGLTTNALVDPQIHENSQTGVIFQPSLISMYIDPRINILPSHCSADQEQGAKGLDSYDALAVNNGLHTSNLDELSAIFRNGGQWNSFLDDLRVGHWPLNDLPSSSNSFSATEFDELSAIFQDQVKRSRRG